MTETFGWPVYQSDMHSPHFTLMPDFSTKKVAIRQHLPTTSRAMGQSDNCYQIALVGTSFAVHSDSMWYVGNWPSWYYDAIWSLMRWIEREHQVPRRAEHPFVVNFGPSSAVRMTRQQWDAFTGWCGREHSAPLVVCDPGDLDIEVLLAQRPPVADPGATFPRPLGDLPIAEDGRLGVSTVSALQRASGAFVNGSWNLPTTLQVQRFFGVDADGVMGAKTIEAIANWAGLENHSIWDATTTRAVQRVLNRNDPEHLPTVSFSSTIIRDLQLALGLTPDGQIGPVTRRGIQNWLGSPDTGILSSVDVSGIQRKVNAPNTGIWSAETTLALQRALREGRVY